jgi:hypothetical protein
LLVEITADQGGFVAGLVNPRKGERHEIDDAHALDLIGCGIAAAVEAEPVSEPEVEAVETSDEKPAETADVAPVETATVSAPERRGPGRPRKDESQ